MRRLRMAAFSLPVAVVTATIEVLIYVSEQCIKKMLN